MKTFLAKQLDRDVSAVMTAVYAATGIVLDDYQALDFFDQLAEDHEYFRGSRGFLLEFIANSFVTSILGRHVPSEEFTTAEFQEFQSKAVARGYRFGECKGGGPVHYVTLFAMNIAERRIGVPDYLAGLRREAFQQGGRA